MRVELHSDRVRFTSDCVGFDGFRVVVIELTDEGEAGSGLRGRPCFRFACPPVQEKGRTLLTFQETPDSLLMSRVSSIIPPNRPFSLSWHQAAGRVGTFEVNRAFLKRC